MKNILKATLLMGVLSLVISSGCKKDEPEPDPIKSIAKTYSLTVSPFQWQYHNSYEQWYYNYNVTIPNGSAVHGYVMSANGKQALTYIDNFYSHVYSMADNSFLSPPYIQFQFINLNTPTIKPAFDQYFYLVVVPANARMSNNLDWSNYEEVKDFYNLKD